GKTLFVTALLRRIEGLGCLKISPARDWPDGHPNDVEAADRGFYLENADRLRRPGKDTALYLAEGAKQVERLRHRDDALPLGLAAALARFGPNLPIVVESSKVVPLLKPVAVVLVVRPPIREMKPTTRDILLLVSDVLFNMSNGGTSATTEIGALQADFPSLRPQYVWSADLSREPLPPEMLIRLNAVLGKAH
ncbi:unnamed protein product, partial [marine sediment metagenome]